MKNLKRSAALVALALTATIALTACGGSKDTTDSASGETKAPVVTIDPEVKAQLNPKAGQAIAPGSITSTKQTDLSGDCSTAVAPIRDYMTKFKSGLAVDPDTLNKVAQLKNAAEKACQPQEYADWYTMEFAGWLYAKTK